MKCPPEIVAELDVSRETLDRLEQLATLLVKWNPKINLVSKSTLDHLWTRHILDSTQVFRLGKYARHWVDIGSGGGFPGLVAALMADEPGAAESVTMIESDQRKCAFLRTVLRETGSCATVLDQRIEQAPLQNADILSARALADLPTLCGLAERHLDKAGHALFPKGANWQKEVVQARESWSFDLDVIQSKTEPEAVILKLGAIQRV